MWQVWDGQLSPAFKSIRLKAFGGWKFDRGTTKLHARILRGKGVQKKKPNMFTAGSSTSATFVLPVRHGTGVALQKRVWTFPKIFNRILLFFDSYHLCFSSVHVVGSLTSKLPSIKGNGNDKNNADRMLRALVCTKLRPQNGSHAGYKTNPKSQ